MAMDDGFNSARLVRRIQYSEISPANSGDIEASASPSTRRSGSKAIQKRIISVPLKEAAGLKQKGDQMSAPPSDSWTWRKYGQKPIKEVITSAVAQRAVRPESKLRGVEWTLTWWWWRILVNTTTLRRLLGVIITPPTTTVRQPDPAPLQTSRFLHQKKKKKKKPVNLSTESHEIILEDRFDNVYGGPLSNGDEFGWLTDFESNSSCTILDSPVLAEELRVATDDDMAMIFKVREEDELLFADLGELPECATVFRRGRCGETAVLHG